MRVPVIDSFRGGTADRAPVTQRLAASWNGWGGIGSMNERGARSSLRMGGVVLDRAIERALHTHGIEIPARSATCTCDRVPG